MFITEKELKRRIDKAVNKAYEDWEDRDRFNRIFKNLNELNRRVKKLEESNET